MFDGAIRITDLNDERVSVYTKYSEPQLLHYNEPDLGIFVAETPVVIERALDFGASALSFFAEDCVLENEQVRKVIEKAGPDVQIYMADISVIKEITGYNLTRGLLAAFRRPELPSPEDLLAKGGCVAVLEDTVNPTNLGAIFRSAAALGVSAALLTHGSTDPFYRRAARVSMGTVFQVPWTYFSKGDDPVDTLHRAGYTVIAMELTENAVPITDPILRQSNKRAVIFGSEGPGVKPQTLSSCDHVAVIPMHNHVDSLNVAASSAVAFWELCGRKL